MGIFSFFTGDRVGKGPYTQTSTNPTIQLQNNKDLTYNDVREIYMSSPIGQRIVLLPIQLGLSGVKHNIPQEFNIDINDYIPKVIEYARNVRLYGISVMFAITKDDDISKPLFTSKLYDKKLKFNVTDPLNTSIEMNNDASSFDYQSVTDISIQGKHVHKNRSLVLTNKKTQLYLKYSNSSLSFAGQSVFAGIQGCINLLNSAICAIERMLLNSSTLLLTQDEQSINSNISNEILQYQAELIQNIKLNSVVILKNGYNLNQLQMGNIDSVAQIFENIHSLLSMSGTDIPPQIFLGNELSSGFSDGSSELITLQNYLDTIRNELLTPTLKFILSYVIYNKVSDLSIAEEIVNNLEITYLNTSNTKELIKNADDIVNSGIMSKDDVEETINNA